LSKHSARGAAWEAQRLRVLNRDGWACQSCGKHLEGADATVDHTDPISQDDRPREDWELVSMCRRCNGAKQDKALVRLAWFNPRWFKSAV